MEIQKYLSEYIQSNFSENDFEGAPLEEVVDSVYATMCDILPETFSDEEFEMALNTAISGAQQLYSADEATINLYNAMTDAEDELGVEFTEEDASYLQDAFSQIQFSEGDDVEQTAYDAVEEYIMQNIYTFMPSAKEKAEMRKDVRGVAESLGVLAPKKYTRWQKVKRFFGIKPKPKSTVKHAWDTAKDVVNSPIGRVVVGAGIQRAQITAGNRVKGYIAQSNARARQMGLSAATDLVNDLFSESEVVTAARNAEADAKAEAETVNGTPVDLESAPVTMNELVVLPKDTIEGANPTGDVENAQKFTKAISDAVDMADAEGKAEASNFASEEDFRAIDTNGDGLIEKDEWIAAGYSEESFDALDTNGDGVIELEEFLEAPDDAVFSNCNFDAIQECYSIFSFNFNPSTPASSLNDGVSATGKGGKGNTYFGDKDGNAVVGTLGTGSEYREWRKRLPQNARGGIKFETGMLTGALTDSLVEGMIAGTYYQGLDTGLKVSSGSIKRGYKGLHALIAPTLDKVQEKLEKSGNKFANWAMPEGASAVEIMDGADAKDSHEVIKVMDQSNYLNKLPESARTLFLMNLSKSGICYVDEKGTLAKRTIVDRLVNTYQKSADEFLELLPGELENIKDIYSKNSLISKESINTDAVFSRLKKATSADQVRQILNEELNVIKKPMTSLADLVNSISNDFIVLRKADQRQFKYVIDRIARDVEIMARKNGEDSISAISRVFLRNLSAATNEVEIKRTVETLVWANVKYLQTMLTVQENFSEEEVEIEGGNANMENSDIKSTGNRTNIVPSNLGHTAGWNETDMVNGDENKSTDAMGDAIDEAKSQHKFNASEHFDQTTFASSQSSDKVSAPGFGVDAYLD